MQSFEQEVKSFLEQQRWAFQDHCNSYDRLDFSIHLPHYDRIFHIDVKEKRQAYNLQNWNLIAAEEPQAFLLDDLAARKILAYAPQSAMLIRNNLTYTYYCLSVVDVFLMPKKRLNRPIHKKQSEWKGKWLMQLGNDQKANSLQEAFQLLRTYARQQRAIFTSMKACYGNYAGEQIDEGGEVRKPEHWKIDVQETR